MLYYFLKITVGIFTRIFYKNPLILNQENIPYDSPLIIASNHPNALCDPCSVAVFSKQRIHFLARGDVFKNKILYSIFVKHLGMVPIFRLLEGAENLHKNEETFKSSAEKLRQKKTILMFSEGLCVQERRLRKLKKGTARIAFASEESTGWKLGLKIIPLGINYNAPHKFRSDMVLNYGKPVDVSQFKEMYIKDKAVAINALTKHLEEKLSELVVHINSIDNDGLVLRAEEILHNENSIRSSKSKKFRATQKLVVAINKLGENTIDIKNKVNVYFSRLEKKSINDKALQRLSEGRPNTVKIIFQDILAAIGLPIFVFGVANNYVPYISGYLLAKRIAKSIEFHASVHLYSSLILYLIFYPIQILTVALTFRNGYVLGAYILLLPLSGLFTMKYYEFVVPLLNLWKVVFLSKKEKDDMLHMRKEIIATLNF